jgi:hypothetical protein
LAEETDISRDSGEPHKRRRLRGVAVVLACLAVAVLIAGCGGKRQDANGSSGTWKVSVLRWKFPPRQPLGKPVEFKLRVRNNDSRDIPQLIVTVTGLQAQVSQPGAASTIRPIWLPDDVNYANVTPYNAALSKSYNLGKLAAGATTTFSLPLTPLRRGTHTVGYKLSPDLFGDGKLVFSLRGGPAQATRTVAIDPTPTFAKKFLDQ